MCDSTLMLKPSTCSKIRTTNLASYLRALFLGSARSICVVRSRLGPDFTTHIPRCSSRKLGMNTQINPFTGHLSLLTCKFHIRFDISFGSNLTLSRGRKNTSRHLATHLPQQHTNSNHNRPEHHTTSRQVPIMPSHSRSPTKNSDDSTPPSRRTGPSARHVPQARRLGDRPIPRDLRRRARSLPSLRSRVPRPSETRRWQRRGKMDHCPCGRPRVG